MLSHWEGVLDRSYLKGLKCVHNRIKECRIWSVKGSPWPNAPQPSQREYLRVFEKVLREVSLVKGSPFPNVPQPSQREYLEVFKRVFRKFSLKGLEL